MPLKIKTFAQFEKSDGGGYAEFLSPLDEIDWPMYEYILCGWVAPSYDNGKIGQAGEADEKKDGVYWYQTVMTVNDRYYYLGSMPAFQQPN